MSKHNGGASRQQAGDGATGDPNSVPGQSADMGRGRGAVNAGQWTGGMAGGGQADAAQGAGAVDGSQRPHPAYHAPYMPYYYAMPGWPGHGYAVPPIPGYAPGPDPMAQRHDGAAHGMSQVFQEIAGGGNGLSSLSKLLDFDDKDFWKGALVGAAAVLLLTNGSVQRALFRGAVKGRDSVQEGMDKVKAGVNKAKQKAGDAGEAGNE